MKLPSHLLHDRLLHKSQNALKCPKRPNKPRRLRWPDYRARVAQRLPDCERNIFDFHSYEFLTSIHGRFVCSGSSASYQLMKDEVKRELSSDRKISGFNQQSGSQAGPNKDFEASQYAADGVYFRCPLLSGYSSVFPSQRGRKVKKRNFFSFILFRPWNTVQDWMACKNQGILVRSTWKWERFDSRSHYP